VGVGVRVALDVGVGVLVGVPVRVLVGVPVLVPVPVLVLVLEPVLVGVPVALDDGAARHGSATLPGAANVAGTFAIPHWNQPQHVTAPPADRAHVCRNPAAMATWPHNATPGTAD
jgi:hypothetical protein